MLKKIGLEAKKSLMNWCDLFYAVSHIFHNEFCLGRKV